MHTIETKDFGLSLVQELVVDHTSLKNNTMDEEKHYTDNRFINISSSGNNNWRHNYAQINILMVGVAHPCKTIHCCSGLNGTKVIVNHTEWQGTNVMVCGTIGTL